MTRRSLLAYPLLLILAIALQLMQLPDAIAPARPLLVPMIFAYWTYISPGGASILVTWLTGLTLDVLLNTPIGQHALALLLMVWLVHWLRRFMLMVSFWQTTLVLIPAWLVYCGLMFWIDGSRGHQADLWSRWMPVLSSVILWPFLYPVLSMLGKPSRD